MQVDKGQVRSLGNGDRQECASYSEGDNEKEEPAAERLTGAACATVPFRFSRREWQRDQRSRLYPGRDSVPTTACISSAIRRLTRSAWAA